MGCRYGAAVNRSKPAAAAKDGNRVVASNRQARRDYEIRETYECGLMLQGSEVKSLRESKVQLTDSHARFERGELWLIGLHIAPYSHAQSHSGHIPDRPRKLLLNRNELDRISGKLDREHLALIPLSLYFSGGRAKLELAVARGKKKYDKREDIARRDAEREAQRDGVRSARQR